MKNIFFVLVIFSVLTTTINSCKHHQKNKSTDEVQHVKNTPSNLNDYNPGLGWKLSWSDEFETATIDTNNWTFQVEPAGRFNDEWQRYTNSSNNAYIENEQLVIKAIHETDSHGMDQYTSARLHTANKHTWKYGKIAAKIKLPYGKGIWPAFWMLGANIDENGGDTPWPQTGEIDILELYGSIDNAVIESNAHYADQSGSHAMSGAAAFKLKQGIFSDAFHIFELEWNANSLTWFVDGIAFSSIPITKDELSEFHKDFFMLLNVAVGGSHAGRPDNTTIFPQYMYVDWVRVYQKNGAED